MAADAKETNHLRHVNNDVIILDWVILTGLHHWEFHDRLLPFRPLNIPKIILNYTNNKQPIAQVLYNLLRNFISV